MKKIIIAAALILTTGVLASQTKLNHTQAAPAITAEKINYTVADSKNLASGD